MGTYPQKSHPMESLDITASVLCRVLLSARPFTKHVTLGPALSYTPLSNAVKRGLCVHFTGGKTEALRN